MELLLIIQLESSKFWNLAMSKIKIYLISSKPLQEQRRKCQGSDARIAPWDFANCSINRKDLGLFINARPIKKPRYHWALEASMAKILYQLIRN